MKQKLRLALVVLGLASQLVAQNAPQSKEGVAGPAKKRVYVDGTAIPANRLLAKDGVDYIDLATFADAVGAKVQSSDGAMMVTTQASKCDTEKPAVEGQMFSQQFRSEVANVPDEIESLRAALMKKEIVPLGPRFDDIDKELTHAKTLVQTDADQAVYYALAYANNTLAIAYYKQVRGVPVQELQQGQLDSMMCSMESKFALMKGVLLAGGSCPVFKRIEGQLPPKPQEKPESPQE